MIPIADSEDRPTWLRARRRGVTATDIARLMKGGPGVERAILKEKIAGVERDLSNVRSARWGTVREEFIADWVQRRFGINPSTILFASADNERHLATPDGTGLDFDERVILSEIKTGKYDLDPKDLASYFHKTYYSDQMEWALYVNNAAKDLFVWEQHDDDWSRWPDEGPAPLGEPKFMWILPDYERRNQLIKRADAFLVKLDAALAGAAEKPDLYADNLGYRVLRAREAVKLLTFKKDALWKELQEHLAARDETSQEVTSRVTWTPPTSTIVEKPLLDEEAAKLSRPDLWDRLTEAKTAWLQHLLDNHSEIVPETVTKPGHLTVTELARKDEDDV